MGEQKQKKKEDSKSNNNNNMTQQKQKEKNKGDSDNNNNNKNINNNKNDNNKNNNNKKDATTKKDETPVTVILKVDMHCDGCASKIVRCLRGFQALDMKSNLVVNDGESLKAENECGKLTITGEVDPNKLKEKLANKMKKKVDFISPPTKKETNLSKSSDKNNKTKPAEKISKELPVTTVVLKVALHCQGCIERIRKTVLKTKGVHDMSIDKDKETVTVKGTMEVKVLVEKLKERLKRKVEVVPPNNKKEKEESGDKEGASGNKGGKANEKKKKGDGGDNNNVKKDNSSSGGDGQGKEKMVDQQTKMEPLTPSFGPGYGYGYGYAGGDYSYGPVYMAQLHAPQMFSDENPNACSIL